MSKMSHWLVAKFKAVDTHYTVAIISLTKVHISIPFFLLFPIRMCFPLLLNDFWQPLPESGGLSPLPRCWAIGWCSIWICTENYMDFHGCRLQGLGGVLVHQSGRWSERGGVSWVRVNRKCVRRGEWTQTSMIGVHAVSYGVGERQGVEERATGREMMVILLLSHPILNSLQHELTFYIQSRMWVSPALLRAQWTLINLASSVGFYTGIYN